MIDIFENITIHILKKVFRAVNIDDIDTMVRITESVLTVVGFLIETITIFILGYFLNRVIQTVIFVVCFGLVRGKDGEHYKQFILCFLATFAVYFVFTAFDMVLNRNSVLIITGILAVVTALVFKKQIIPKKPLT